MEYHKAILRQAIHEVDKLRIYAIGKVAVENVNPDIKFDSLSDKTATEMFLAEHTPSNLYFDLSTDWARDMVVHAAKQRSSENPFRSIYFTQVPQGFHNTLAHPLNARICSIDLETNVRVELEGWYPKLEVEHFILYNLSTEEMTPIAQNMRPTVKGFEIHSKDYVHMASLLQLIPRDNREQIRRIGMNASLFNSHLHMIRSHFPRVDVAVLYSPIYLGKDILNFVLTEWKITAVIVTCESKAGEIKGMFSGVRNLQIIGPKIEYGEASYELKVIDLEDRDLKKFLKGY